MASVREDEQPLLTASECRDDPDCYTSVTIGTLRR